jgi:hypothetical protein
LTISNVAVLENIDDQIKQAEIDLVKRSKSLDRAQVLFTDAENRLDQLKNQRDLNYINGLKEVDWELVFKYSKDETFVLNRYREEVLNNSNLNYAGKYNSATMQPIFYIAFESDSVNELNELKSQVEFIFLKLNFQPKEKIKCIEVRNLSDDDYLWELIFSDLTKKYSVEKNIGYQKKEKFDFDTLDAALKKIQLMSNVALETHDMKFIG